MRGYRLWVELGIHGRFNLESPACLCDTYMIKNINNRSNLLNKSYMVGDRVNISLSLTSDPNDPLRQLRDEGSYWGMVSLNSDTNIYVRPAGINVRYILIRHNELNKLDSIPNYYHGSHKIISAGSFNGSEIRNLKHPFMESIRSFEMGNSNLMRTSGGIVSLPEVLRKTKIIKTVRQTLPQRF